LESEVERTVLDALDESGYTPEEAIPGLIQAVYNQAAQLGRGREQALDEAADLLADGD
jgi:hypothetical protein